MLKRSASIRTVEGPLPHCAPTPAKYFPSRRIVIPSVARDLGVCPPHPEVANLPTLCHPERNECLSEAQAFVQSKDPYPHCAPKQRETFRKYEARQHPLTYQAPHSNIPA
jgi:hypothetical protein